MKETKNSNKSKLDFSMRRLIIKDAKQKTASIIKENESKGIKLSKDEVNDIYKKERTNIAKKYVYRSFFAALGLTGAIVSGTKMLTSPTVSKDINNSKIEDTVDKDISKENDRDKFVNNIKVDEPINPEKNLEDKEDTSDLVINSLLDSYNEKYDSNISLEDLKYMESTNKIYLYQNDNGDYSFDPVRSFTEAPLSMDSATIYSIIDKNSNKIIFSVGELKKYTDNAPEYKIVDVRTAFLAPGKNFDSIHKEGNYLHSNEISLDTKADNTSIEETLYAACQSELQKVIENNKDKTEDSELDK